MAREYAFDVERDARRLANWKPAKGSAAREKASEDRHEASVIQRVRAACVDGPMKWICGGEVYRERRV